MIIIDIVAGCQDYNLELDAVVLRCQVMPSKKLLK